MSTTSASFCRRVSFLGTLKLLVVFLAALIATQAKTYAETSVTAPNEFVWTSQYTAGVIFIVLTLLIYLVFWRVAATGKKNPVDQIDTVSAYHLRHKIFIGALIVVVVILGATMSRLPYSDAPVPPDHIVYVTAQQFSFIYTPDPIRSRDDLENSDPILSLEIPKDSLVEFRVTSLDVNHGFGIYDPNGHIISQVQAMPEYVNKLQVHFTEPGKYQVLCLEYCGAAHQTMHSEFSVE